MRDDLTWPVSFGNCFLSQRSLIFPDQAIQNSAGGNSFFGIPTCDQLLRLVFFQTQMIFLPNPSYRHQFYNFRVHLQQVVRGSSGYQDHSHFCLVHSFFVRLQNFLKQKVLHLYFPCDSNRLITMECIYLCAATISNYTF